MNNKSVLKVVAMGACFWGTALAVQAQDTTKRKTIDITSTFKPVLREAAKINFNAAPPVADTSRPVLNYNIPVQNLYFTYQPAELKPVALQMDSLRNWLYNNYIKVGIGNVHQPYIKAGFSFGNGENSYFNVFANYYNSKGDKPFQKNSLASVGAAGTYKTSKNLEWNGTLGFSSNDYYLYGYKPETLEFSKSDLRQRFQTIEAKVHFRNLEPTEFGLNYHPSLRVSVFGDNHSAKGRESNTVLNLPLEKTFGDEFAFKLGVTADLTNYSVNTPGKKYTDNNNLYQVGAAVLYKTPNLYIHGGALPTWQNKKFNLLPNLMADITTNDKQLTLQLGYIGYFLKGSYQRFASLNSWIAQPDSLMNTRVSEMYFGLKGSLAGHFSYSAKLGLQKYRDMNLFVNDTTDGKTFLTIYEPQINVVNLHTEVGYLIGEKFNATAGFNLNWFTKVEREMKAWGMIPIELNVGLRWQMLKDLWFHSDLWVWDGAQYRTKTGDAHKSPAGFDVNAGAEFRITKNFNLWLQMNNILNNKYERWNQYEVFGFNILGGITYSFNQR
ncbi:hypothetical protein [Paraflavitalea sp. CAU 1676]|uniref:hypothetical protein n=1 Tax=Paraflavitalea sp. CAU 1676 TaxID=3032598 RepID=UPI0023DA6E2B|nr:hypothetical protein [Paraflavitalea sp. CAU 1676]MDF2191796.1 hypothetical protein [Paraflavitalea sp. CAU 1676]